MLYLRGNSKKMRLCTRIQVLKHSMYIFVRGCYCRSASFLVLPDGDSPNGLYKYTVRVVNSGNVDQKQDEFLTDLVDVKVQEVTISHEKIKRT